MRLCDCARERIAKKSVPLRYWSAKLTDFYEPIQQLIREWMQSPSDGLFIRGAVGVGKTHLACAIAIAHNLRRDDCCGFRTAAQIYREIRQSMNPGASERALLDKYSNWEILVIDDLGAGGLSDFERRTILEILDRRLNSLRTTLVTSNWSLAEISERMDDRIASRLSSFQQIEMRGQDKRIRGVGTHGTETP